MHENIQMLKLRLDQIRTKFKLTSGQAAQQTLLEKGKHVLSIVSEAIELVFGGQVIASGGFSVEYYTEGQHATQDIDLIINNVASNKELNELFLQLGFSQIGGRAWALDDIGVFIEKVDDAIFDGDYATITVDQLFNIKFVNVNDIIIDRVKGFVHWKVDNYQDQIIDLVLLN